MEFEQAPPSPSSSSQRKGSQTSLTTSSDHASPSICQLPPVKPTLQRFTLYETRDRYYLLGCNKSETRFRFLVIDRTQSEFLSVEEDQKAYTRKEAEARIGVLRDASMATGGLEPVAKACGIIGFVRFLEGHYLFLITERVRVGMIGGRHIYRIDKTVLLPLANRPPVKSDENRYRALFQSIDLSKNFYFSYAYDLTHTLQHNMSPQNHPDLSAPDTLPFNDRFVWNTYLLQELLPAVRSSEWILPIVHGFFNQKAVQLWGGRRLYITIMSRRSRFFAGPRYFKRGIDGAGHVANEVETEQIVHEETNGHPASGRGLFSSLVQLRGSIPLFWYHPNMVSPNPAIVVQSTVDPEYTATKMHFDDLHQRFTTPVVCFNLIKEREKKPRETLLGTAYEQCISKLNTTCYAGDKSDLRLRYITFDFLHQSKERSDVLQLMIEITEDILDLTGTFSSQIVDGKLVRLQNGVPRVNCIDCLDRTNIAMYCIGVSALARQLKSLELPMPASVVDGKTLPSELLSLLMDMYGEMGDAIAQQYGGSEAMHKTTMRENKKGEWNTKKRDNTFIAVKRYLSNTFGDSEKQRALNLFLGLFAPAKGRTNLWDINVMPQTVGPRTDDSPAAEKREAISEYFGTLDWWKGEPIASKFGSSKLLMKWQMRLLFEEQHPSSRLTCFDSELLIDFLTPSVILTLDDKQNMHNNDIMVSSVVSKSPNYGGAKSPNRPVSPLQLPLSADHLKPNVTHEQIEPRDKGHMDGVAYVTDVTDADYKLFEDYVSLSQISIRKDSTRSVAEERSDSFVLISADDDLAKLEQSRANNNNNNVAAQDTTTRLAQEVQALRLEVQRLQSLVHPIVGAKATTPPLSSFFSSWQRDRSPKREFSVSTATPPRATASPSLSPL